jgi:hypothetical protein
MPCAFRSNRPSGGSTGSSIDHGTWAVTS